jgi:hypothetical protein
MAKSADGEQQRAGKTLISIARDFDFRGFLRLSGWGTAAIAALFFALATAMSGSGAQRPSLAQGAEAPVLTPTELTAHATAVDAAVRQISDTVRELAAEREHSTARLAALEHSLDDITGSVKRLASATPGPATPQASAIASTGAPQSILPPTAAPSSVPQPVPRPTVTSSNPDATEPAAGEPPTSRTTSDLNGALSVDVGGAVNFDGLRVLWNSTREHNPPLFEGLFPTVAVRESSKTHNAELRLLVGPLAGADDAGRICAALAAAHRYCQPVAFEGQRLQLAEQAPERANPERATAPAPQHKRSANVERKR